MIINNIKYNIMRLKFHKRITSKVTIGELKFVSRTIPYSGGYSAPQLDAELFPKLALGFVSVICLVIVFLFANHASAADWKFIAKSVTGNMYYDKSSIKKVSDNIISVWTKTVYNEYGKKNGFSLLRVMGKEPNNPEVLSHEEISFEFDRFNKKYRVSSVSIYDKQGHVLHSLPKFIGEGEEIPPESFAERLENKVYSLEKSSRKKK